MNKIQFHIEAIKKVAFYLKKSEYLKFFIPGVIIALLFWQVFLVTETINDTFSFVKSIPLIGDLLYSIIGGTIGVIRFILEQLFIFFILTVLSPFNTILSEKLDAAVSGKVYKFDPAQILADLLRMIVIVTIALILELLATGVYWAATGIIGFHLLDTPIYFIIAAFFYGFSFYDYSLERDRIGISGSMNYAFKNSFLMLLTGAIFLLLYKIPFIGVIIAPVITTMISTIVYLKNKTNNE